MCLIYPAVSLCTDYQMFLLPVKRKIIFQNRRIQANVLSSLKFVLMVHSQKKDAKAITGTVLLDTNMYYFAIATNVYF